MRKLREFKCSECDYIEERFCNDDDEHLECNKCKGKADVLLSLPKYFGNSTGRSPSAT